MRAGCFGLTKIKSGSTTHSKSCDRRWEGENPPFLWYNSTMEKKLSSQVQAKIDEFWAKHAEWCEENGDLPDDDDQLETKLLRVSDDQDVYVGGGYYRITQPETVKITNVKRSNPFGGPAIEARQHGDKERDESVCWPTPETKTVFFPHDEALVIGWTEYGYGTTFLLHPEKLVIENWHCF